MHIPEGEQRIGIRWMAQQNFRRLVRQKKKATCRAAG
jgi:hypothetical protein